MIEYTEQAQMVDALRLCGKGDFASCSKCGAGVACVPTMRARIRDAADMIEALYAKTQKPQHELDERIVEYEAEIRDLNRDIEDLESRVEELREELGYA